jgi:hypothetical protein
MSRTSYRQTLWYLPANCRSFILWSPDQWASQCSAIECDRSFYCALFCAFATRLSKCPIGLRAEHPILFELVTTKQLWMLELAHHVTTVIVCLLLSRIATKVFTVHALAEHSVFSVRCLLKYNRNIKQDFFHSNCKSNGQVSRAYSNQDNSAHCH